MKRRTGPLWRAYYAVYWTLAVGLGASIAISVTYRAFETPAQAAPTDALSEAECEARFFELYQRLRDRGASLFNATDLVEVDAQWQAFSTRWHAELGQLEAQCRVKADPSRKPLRALANDIDRMHLAYTTALRGFDDIGRKPLNSIETRRK